MIKQKNIINAKYLIFYLKQKLKLDALFKKKTNPKTTKKKLLLVQTNPQILHTKKQLLQNTIFHILQNNKK